MRSLAVFLLILFNLITSLAWAQIDYVENDSAYVVGSLIDRGVYANNREIHFVREKKTTEEVYHPGEISEFGFGNGLTYFSKTVDEGGVSKSYFLMEQVNGRSRLFILQLQSGNRFFTEKDNTLIEITRERPLQEVLQKVLNPCPGIVSSLPLVRRNTASLSRAFRLNNSCYDGFFPTVRGGILVGYSTTTFAVRDQLSKYVVMQGPWSPFIGAFFETPVGKNPRWFANLQVQVQQNTFRASRQFYNTRSDYHIQTTGLNLPILFKYRSTSRHFRTFLLAGPMLSYFAQHQCDLLETTVTPVSNTRYDHTLDNISQFQLNATVGLGVEFSVDKNRSVGLEARYSAGSGLRADNNQVVYGLQVLASVYF